MFKLNPGVTIIDSGQLKIDPSPALPESNFPIEVRQGSLSLFCIQEMEYFAF